MKIVHLCVNGPFTEGWGYQENLLAKYHALAGHTVTVIAGQEKHLPAGEIVQAPCGETTMENGVRLIRVAASQSGLRIWRRMFSRHDVLPLFRRLQPDLIMIHGMVGDVSALQVRRYVKREHPQTHVVADIHQDFYNTVFPKNAVKKWALRMLQRRMNRLLYPVLSRLYYITPSSGEMAAGYYGAPADRLSFLPLGGDTAEAEQMNRAAVRDAVLNELGFSPDDILLCHGGKLNAEKRTAELICAVKELHKQRPRMKLILFGAVDAAYRQTLEPLMEDAKDYIRCLGHQTQSAYYRLFAAADIAVFPGSQSALWQQAAACGLALVVKGSAAGAYLDRGGNTLFLEEGSAAAIRQTLEKALESDRYLAMKSAARQKAAPFFSYRMIAQRVIDEAMQ